MILLLAVPHKETCHLKIYTEIKMMIDQGEENGTIQEDEKELINNVFRI